jgi:hypothetical protein
MREVARGLESVHRAVIMPTSDRAFRALARAQPDVVVGLLHAITPNLLPPHAVPVPDDVAPTHLDGLPPEIDADFAARMTSDELLHMECQGYRDSGFSERVLWYHVGFALRYRSRRRVRTVALWLIPLPSTQPRNEVAAGDITVKVTTIVLPEVPASCLLSDPATACFAAGSDAEGRSNEVLCTQVAAALRARGASWPERHMAVVAAAMQGRYGSMVTAMEQAKLEPVIIEDLVKFGEDRALRRMLRRVLVLRKLALNADGEARIDACTDLATLQRWLDQAVLAASADEALQ